VEVGKMAIIAFEYISWEALNFESAIMTAIASNMPARSAFLGAGGGIKSRRPSFWATRSAPGITSP
jgi:hypothetical protein